MPDFDTVTLEEINEYKEFLTDIYEAELCLVDEPAEASAMYKFTLYNRDGSAITKHASPYSLMHFNRNQERLC